VRICTWNIQLGLRLEAVLDVVRRHEDFRHGFTHKLQQMQAVLDDMEARPAVAVALLAGNLNTFGP
jgi:hypothetical protein